MTSRETPPTYDYIVIGSGFGGSVAAMRLAEKGYRVLVVERGRRFEDADFPRTNWDVRKSLWLPALRCFGILQMSFFRGLMVLHGSGVGGGSLGYANVLMAPDEEAFRDPMWRHPVDWKEALRPHYETARRMLGVTPTPRLSPADEELRHIAREMGQEATFRPTQVGVYFGQPGVEVPDPYFGGQGPPRAGCTYCGGCMVGCRYNAKNTLMKNYLHFAERHGARVLAETEVRDLRPLPRGEPGGARYEVVCRRATAWRSGRPVVVRARGVVLAAGVLGTLRLLLRCRDVTRTLPDLSPRLGENVRTNSEALLGVVARKEAFDHSQGIAISASFRPDPLSEIQPVRYPAGSSFMRLLAVPLQKEPGRPLWRRWTRFLVEVVAHPLDFLRLKFFPRWAERTTILLTMQRVDNRMRLRAGRRGLATEHDAERRIRAEIEVGHRVARRFAGRIGAVPGTTFLEGLFDIPVTAHILGGCPFGESPEEGAVDSRCRVWGYPEMIVLDGSIVPANPGMNPSLTITAFAEYAMSFIAPAGGGGERL